MADRDVKIVERGLERQGDGYMSSIKSKVRRKQAENGHWGLGPGELESWGGRMKIAPCSLMKFNGICAGSEFLPRCSRADGAAA